MKKFGKGLDVMSDEEKQIVLDKCGKLMDRFGYKVRAYIHCELRGASWQC